MEVQPEHICHYATETLTVRNRKDLALQSKTIVNTMNILVGLTALVPFLAICCSCGGNIMLTILIVVALVPLGYIVVKFF